jgi:phosphate transport system ATP-binding protein
VVSHDSSGQPKVRFEGITVHFGPHLALKDLNLDVQRNEILGIIGPAGSGKSTLLRALNRTLELTPGARRDGKVRLDGDDIDRVSSAPELRRRIGMVAPLPVGLPMSIYDNVAFAPRMAGVRDRGTLEGIVETCLRQAALWDEVKDRLSDLGTRLSGGQQQRLTIARALSHDPEVLCLDEFSIAIDPVTTMRIEEVLRELKPRLTILLVTNLVQQARRLADRTAFILSGELVEVGPTEQLFGRQPKDRRTFGYVHGMFG